MFGGSAGLEQPEIQGRENDLVRFDRDREYADEKDLGQDDDGMRAMVL